MSTTVSHGKSAKDWKTRAALGLTPSSGAVAEEDAATGGAQDAGHDAQERALAAPRRPYEGEELALTDVEVERPQDADLPVVELLDRVEPDEDLAGLGRDGGRVHGGSMMQRSLLL